MDMPPVHHMIEPFSQIHRINHVLKHKKISKQNKMKLLNSLKQWKRITSEKNKRFLFLDIPTCKIYAFEKKRMIFSQKVIIGRNNSKTPLFFPTYISSLIFNPSWQVPQCMLKKKINQIKRNPQYAIRHKYVIKNYLGEKINPYNISKYHPNNLSVCMPSNKHNPMGDIKFKFSGSSSILMHGYPVNYLFKNKNRYLSAGCVRIEDEYKMASWIIYKSISERNIKRVMNLVNKGKTSHLKVKFSLPIFMSNIQMGVDEKYNIVIRKSPYGEFM